jgi:NAD(P)H-hydrate epimerase
MSVVSADTVRKLFPKRKDWCHKGDFGKLLVVGGSRKYSGSPALSAMAAYRTGADLVTVAAPERAANIIASFSPDIIACPLDGDFLDQKNLKPILELAKDSDAIVIGGGLGREKETLRTVLDFLKSAGQPVVVDADAIHAISMRTEIIRDNWIITPHPKEFRILTHEEPEPNVENRERVVKYFASRFRTTILLKGFIDVISNGGDVFLNRTGNPCMTKGGTGDTLAGICGALLARGARPLEAACAGAYINGLAGSLAAKEHGEGMLASDILNYIPRAIK